MGFAGRFRFLSSVLLVGVSFALYTRPAHASGPEEIDASASTLSQMEQKAAVAEPRDRCFLYTELFHDWTELAGREMASGDDAAATAAMQHADADAGKLKVAIDRDSKRLKNAELLMEHSMQRLSDMLHVSSQDERSNLQAVLRHVDSVHDALLAAVFTH